MRAWLPQVLSELRWWSGSSDCAIGLPLLLLSCICSWGLGLFTGAAIAVLILSPSCRRLVILVLQGAIALLGPVQHLVPGPVPGAADWRVRLQGYRNQ